MLPSDRLSSSELREVREIFGSVWGADFSPEDWSHMFPGVHFLLDVDGRIVSHGAVVERELRSGHHRIVTGWVENVATRPDTQGRGYGTIVMRAATEHIARRYALGGLDTSRHGFYERLGWRRWKGPLSVRTDAGEVRTPDEDDFVMVLLTPSSPPRLDLEAPLSCDWRPGDVW